MSSDKFNDTLNSLLAEGRINHVLKVLRQKCETEVQSHPDIINLIRRIDTVADTYRHLRGFLIGGNPDPNRGEMYSRLKSQISSIARDYLFVTNDNRIDSFFAEYRLNKVREINVKEILAQLDKVDFHIDMAANTEADPASFIKKREDLVDTLFRYVWTLPPWASEEREEIKKLLNDDGVRFEIRAQIISALLLGMLKFNDPEKFMILLDAYDSIADERLAARALMAIVIILHRWGRHAVSTPAIESALENISDSLLTYTRLKDIVMTLIRTRDTDRVSREVNEAFNSTMKEITPEMLEKLRQEGMAVDSGETGMNPEWEKLMKNKDLEEKMKNINDMQLEGMDVMMQTFSRLKSFPFFRNVSNWFLPFSSSHSSVAPLFDSFDSRAFNAMGDATDMCSGDRFSFALGIMQMPEDRRGMLASHLGQQLENLNDMLKDRENVRKKPLFASEALSFARDLYRFSKIYPKKKDFFDPFAQDLDFLNLPVLGQLLADNEFVVNVADFYFDHSYYGQALDLYEDAVAFGKADRNIFEKMGYCCQRASDFSGALNYYEKADLFSSDADDSSTWLLRKLAFTNKALGNYGKAAEYYKKILDRNPDDLKVEFHLGSVLLRSGDMKGAMEKFSKVHYLDPAHAACERAYNRIKGHEAFLSGNYAEALERYEKAAGEDDRRLFIRSIISEIQSADPEADILTLKILLDRE